MSPIDDDASSVSTVQHANTASEQLNHTLAENVPPSPPTSLPGFGRVPGLGRANDRFDLSMHPRLSQASRPPEYTHLRTIMINACVISNDFRKKFTYQPDTSRE